MSDPSAPPRKLLVLDLDETLVHAREAPLDLAEDFRVGPYFIYRRPNLDAFIARVRTRYELCVWTSSGQSYAAQVIERIFPADSLAFMWSHRRCTLVRDWNGNGYETLKNLAKLKRRGYRLESVVAVDDTPAKYARHYGNLVTVREFLGDPADTELPLLADYLVRLADVANVRSVEKRRWRESAPATGEAPARPHDRGPGADIVPG